MLDDGSGNGNTRAQHPNRSSPNPGVRGILAHFAVGCPVNSILGPFYS